MDINELMKSKRKKKLVKQYAKNIDGVLQIKLIILL